MATEKNLEKAMLLLLIAAFIVLSFNTAQINSLATGKKEIQSVSTGIATGQVVSGNLPSQSVAGIIDVIPKGVPAIYGQELSVSFDDVSADNPQVADATIKKLGTLDQQIKLTGDDLQRYISIAGSISCEYCCGAPAIIFTEDRGNYKAGDAACGCAHSYAMRGLAKYLITEHGSEYTDDQILEEMGKWKTLFFPTQLTQKAQVLQDKGIELNYINLASNKYRGVEEETSGGMVGGC